MSKHSVPDPDPSRDMVPELHEVNERLRASRSNLARVCDELETAREQVRVRTKRGRAEFGK